MLTVMTVGFVAKELGLPFEVESFPGGAKIIGFHFEPNHYDSAKGFLKYGHFLVVMDERTPVCTRKFVISTTGQPVKIKEEGIDGFYVGSCGKDFHCFEIFPRKENS